MHKTLIVAQSEFTTLVKTKAFLISLILMPIVMGGSIMIVRKTLLVMRNPLSPNCAPNQVIQQLLG